MGLITAGVLADLGLRKRNYHFLHPYDFEVLPCQTRRTLRALAVRDFSPYIAAPTVANGDVRRRVRVGQGAVFGWRTIGCFLG